MERSGQDHHWPKQNPWLKWHPTDAFFHTRLEILPKPLLLCFSRQSVYSASTEAKRHEGIWNQGHATTEKKEEWTTEWFNVTLNAKYRDLNGCHSFQIHVTLISMEHIFCEDVPVQQEHLHRNYFAWGTAANCMVPDLFFLMLVHFTTHLSLQKKDARRDFHRLNKNPPVPVPAPTVFTH